MLRARFADIGLVSFVRGKVFWERERVRLVLLLPEIARDLLRS